MKEYQEPSWKEYFYKDELNVSIPLVKKGCKYIILNVPDLSLLMGWKRKAANIGFLFIALYFGSLILIEGFTFIGLLEKIIIVSLIATVLYSRTVAFVSLKYVEQYQKKAKEMLK